MVDLIDDGTSGEEPPGDEPTDDVTLGRKATGGFIWAFLSFLMMQVATFATYTIATRVLGPEGIGVVATALTLIFYIDVLLDLGLTAALIYEQERGQSERVQVAFTVNLSVSIAVVLAVYFGADAINNFFHVGDAAIFQVVALLIVVKGLGQVPNALLERELNFRRKFRADIVRAVGRFVVSVALLLAGVGPISMIIGVTAAEAGAVAVTWVLTRFKPRLRFDAKIAGEMIRFGAAMFGARLVGLLWLNGDYLVIARHFGGKSKAYGNYYTAFRLPELVLGSVYNLFANVAFPAYSAARTQGWAVLRDASLKSLRLLTLFGFTAGVGMAMIARDFITSWFGDAYAPAIPVMQLLCIAGAFASIGFASGDLFAAIGKPKLGLYFNLLFVPILMGGFIAVVDRGIVAIATVHLIVIVPYGVFRIEVANRLLGTTWRQSLAALRPAAVTVAGMLALALPLRLLLGAGALSLGAIVLAGALGAFLGLLVGDRVMLGEIRAGGEKALARIRRTPAAAA